MASAVTPAAWGSIKGRLRCQVYPSPFALTVFYDITQSVANNCRILDDEILVELASVVEGSTEEERNNYNRGLRQTIASMREQGIKDFETVVTGIASYRRQFLGDDTRVLKLPPSQPPQTSQHQHHQQRGSSFSYT